MKNDDKKCFTYLHIFVDVVVVVVVNQWLCKDSLLLAQQSVTLRLFLSLSSIEHKFRGVYACYAD